MIVEPGASQECASVRQVYSDKAMGQQCTPVPGGTVTTPKGFRAGATYAGLKTYAEDKLDLCILSSETPCAVAGVFTRNSIVSPSVELDKERLARRRAQAVIVNSGCANACVGPQGMIDAKEMATLAAGVLGIDEEDVLVASTGIIGVELPMAMIRSAVERIDLAPDGGGLFARAIMTTDSRPKEAAVTLEVDGKPCVIGAAVKGVGMIHPTMATLLCFITTDAAVEPGFLQTALKSAADLSFNMVTIDGDSSTNDTALLLANGLAGNPPVQAESPEAEAFTDALTSLCVSLAKEVARDGEGATKLLEVTVEGAVSVEDARLAARTVASSPLVKTAIHGADPNWGRVMMALGRSGAALDEGRLALYLNEVCVFDEGGPVPFFHEAAKVSMQEPEVRIRANLRLGSHEATAWGCDLTEKYVRFNSEYTT
ncbi:MAG: bifunctional glutamate N-acetyltransferase/amino-acid acetyltransferase ArgJ [Dehalococcoidia bacterium]